MLELGSPRRATLAIDTRGRGMHDLTPALRRFAAAAAVEQGLLHLWCLHTSCSLLVSENADPEVQRDLERFMARLVPDGDTLFRHDAEGPDDMPAHVRSVLTGTSLAVPVEAGELKLGTWQSICLWEHRHSGHHRRVVLSLVPI